jgi:peptide/nickel transport system substrate-binding protein
MSEKDHTANDFPRRRLLQGIGGAGAVSLAGCIGGGGEGTATDEETDMGGGGGDDDTDTPTAEESEIYADGTLNIAQVKSPVEFDPVVLNDVPSALVADRVFEGLLEYDAQTGHVPVLATEMPSTSNDGTTYEVTIEDAATFHNGDSVTAEDVKYSLLAPVREETENASEVNMIDSITVVDDVTAEINLKYPYGPFLSTLHRNIVPKSVRENDKQAFNKENPVGSGAFQFDDWSQGDFARVTRWEDYWGEPMPTVSEIQYNPIEKPTTRQTTLQNGENDVMQEIPPNLWNSFQNMGNAEIESVPGIGYFYAAFNCKEGPTTDPAVREAVDYCFNMDDAVSNFVEPTGVRQYSPLPKSLAESWDMPLDEWKQIPHDKNVDEASALFDEAGVPSDYNWRIIVPPDDKREQIGLSIGNGLQEAGFQNVEVQRFDWGQFLDLYISGSEDDYNIYTLGWSGVPDPDSFTYYLLGRTEDTLGVTNGTYWGNNSDAGKQAAEKFVTARESADREERKQLYEEAITTALEERAHLPSYNLKNSYGVRNYVHDFKSHAVDGHTISSNHNNTWVEEGAGQ